jgi:arsenate reductase (thioredoxin)
MRGSSRKPPNAPPAPAPVPPKPLLRKKILFVCIGNSCRSQMAEGFAKAWGGGRFDIYSAGLSPASIVQPETHQIMLDYEIQLHDQHPKGIELMTRTPFDLIVNMSGEVLPRLDGRVLDWRVPDPIGQSDAVYKRVADDIAQRVRKLLNEL